MLHVIVTSLIEVLLRDFANRRTINEVNEIVTFVFPSQFQGGTYVVNLINIYGPGISTLFIVFLEAVAVSWVYGVKRFSRDIERMIGSKPNRFWTTCWRYSPIFIFVRERIATFRTKFYVRS